MKKLSLLIVLPLLLTLAGCGEKAPGGARKAEGAHAEGEKFTLFTVTTELFLEMPPLVAGKPASLSVYLTRLSDFKPVKEGRLEVVLVGGGGTEERFVSEATSEAGIYKLVLTPRQAGEREITLVLKTPQGDVVHELGPVSIFASADDAAKAHGGHEHHEEGIAFTKAQQWKVDFATVEAVKGVAREAVVVTATLRAHPDGEAILAAPAAGRVQAAGPFPHVGMKVKQGQVLAYLAPRLGGETDYATLQVSAGKTRVLHEQARRERERMESLFIQEAVPEKRLLAARAEENIAAAELEAASQRLGQYGGGKGGIPLRASVSGVLADVKTAPGGYAQEGATLFHVADTGRLWVEARIPESDAVRIKEPAGIWFTVDGVEGAYDFEFGRNARLVALGGVVDTATRTVPLIVEIANPDRALKLGMTVKARLRTVASHAEAVLVPASALQDENGIPTIYVQTGGESFERKVVTPGARDGDRVAILDGLQAGQRVVSRGAYLVRLAASKTETAGHGHAH